MQACLLYQELSTVRRKIWQPHAQCWCMAAAAALILPVSKNFHCYSICQRKEGGGSGIPAPGALCAACFCRADTHIEVIYPHTLLQTAWIDLDVLFARFAFVDIHIHITCMCYNTTISLLAGKQSTPQIRTEYLLPWDGFLTPGPWSLWPLIGRYTEVCL